MKPLKTLNTSDYFEKDKEAISSHYDLPFEFFAKFLGPRMAYSCAYFADENNSLEVAEANKLELLARKLLISPEDKVLDIGCGWGSFMFYAVEKCDCSVTGITLAQEQIAVIRETAKARGFSTNMHAGLMHAYDLAFENQTFDKVVTVGAIEHMEDLDRVFSETYRVLKDDGLFLVHGMTQPWFARKVTLDGTKTEVSQLLDEHFGIGHLKSLWEVMASLEKAGFEILDHENISQHYKLTVEAWLENLQKNEQQIVDRIIPEEKYREFIAFMAAYILGFEGSGTLCNQILCKKIFKDEIRMPAPLTREHMSLGDSNG